MCPAGFLLRGDSCAEIAALSGSELGELGVVSEELGVVTLSDSNSSSVVQTHSHNSSFSSSPGDADGSGA